MTTEFKDTLDVSLEGQTHIKSSERPIIGSKGLRWAIILRKESLFFYYNVYLRISKQVKINARGRCTALGCPQKQMFQISFCGDRSEISCDKLICQSFAANGIVRVNVTFTDFEREEDAKIPPPLISTKTIFERKDDAKIPPPLSTKNNFYIKDFATESNYSPDVQIVVDDNIIKMHRHVLFMMSPVFQAEFAHDTEEAKTGTVKITDFDFETVKNVIDYCHGRECNSKTALDCVNMLRFADKYDIRSVIKTFEPIVFKNVTNDNFCVIAQYAWDCERKDLQSKCVQFFKDNVAVIVPSPQFVNMDPFTQNAVIRAGGSLGTGNEAAANRVRPIASLSENSFPTVFDLTTDSDHYPTDAWIVVGEQRIDVHRHFLNMVSSVFYEKFNGNTKEKKTGTIEIADFDFTTIKCVIDFCYGQHIHYEPWQNTINVARFGQKYKIKAVIETVEHYLITKRTLSTDNFCSIAQYAWEFGIADLKQKCAEFFRHNHEKIQFHSPDFINMDPVIAMDIIRTAKK